MAYDRVFRVLLMSLKTGVAERVILPTTDLAFRKLFGDERHKDVLAGFIRDVFNLNVEPMDLEITDSYSIEMLPIGRFGMRGKRREKLQQRLRDVTVIVNLARHNNGDVGGTGPVLGAAFGPVITLEMQVQPQKPYVARALNYASGVYLKFSSEISSARPVWSMNILAFNLFDDDVALRSYGFYDVATFQPLDPELMRIGFFELPKVSDSPALRAWRTFFLTGKVADDAPEYLKAAAGIIRWVNLTPKERRMADYLTRARQDRKNQDEYVREEGRAEARAEERAIADQRVAAERAAREAERERVELETLTRHVRSARNKGLSDAEIADLLGISEAEVSAIPE